MGDLMFRDFLLSGFFGDRYKDDGGDGAFNFRLWRFSFVLMLFCLFFTLRVQAAPKFYARVKHKNLLVNEQTMIVTRGRNITYRFKIDKESVASVNRKGVITAHKRGRAVLTIKGIKKSSNGRQTIGVKQVKLRVYNCRLRNAAVSLQQGSFYENALEIKGETLNRRVRYQSLDPAVASVNAAGTVYAAREGTTSIIVRVGQYLEFACSVTVTAQSLEGDYLELLVNHSHSYGAVNLKELFLESANLQDASLSYFVQYPDYGGMEGDVYHASKSGTVSVTVYGGAYKQTYTIRQFRWQAHRGYLDIMPENTIDAFIAAALYGANRIETDLRVTSDGELVVFHDSTVNRMTDGTGSLGNFTFAELRQLHIDNGNNVSQCTHPYIPTIGEFLSICKRYNVLANIEIKSFGKAEQQQEAVLKLYREIEKAGMLNMTIVSSFSTERLKLFRECTNDIIPVCSSQASVVSELQAMGVPNIGSNAAVFGAHSTADYCPVIGRKGLAWTQY